MVKGEFIKELSERAGFTMKEATVAYDAFVEIIADALEKKEKVSLMGFANFELKHKEAKKGINPKTGATVEIPASWAPTCKMSKSFKARFN